MPVSKANQWPPLYMPFRHNQIPMNFEWRKPGHRQLPIGGRACKRLFWKILTNYEAKPWLSVEMTANGHSSPTTSCSDSKYWANWANYASKHYNVQYVRVGGYLAKPIRNICQMQPQTSCCKAPNCAKLFDNIEPKYHKHRPTQTHKYRPPAHTKPIQLADRLN